MPAVNLFIQHFSAIWDKSPVYFPAFQSNYTTEVQITRESRFNQFQKELKKLEKRKKISALKEGDPARSFFPVFRDFMENVFDFEPVQLEIILSDKFKNVSKDFFYQARKFGPELSPENIYQGLRNVWIMNGVQLMMGIPVEITPSVFAYSMIYPYSDNLLDEDTLSDAEKKAFSRRFNDRLHGLKSEPQSHAESQLFTLVGMFEEQFPRTQFPEVYASLYAIQKGQTRSLELINCNGLEDAVIREICFEKGGASVLADGYLVAGRLNPGQERALFGYGIYLQLLDDIQDVKEDTQAATKTLFSCRGKQDLGLMMNKTIHFGRSVLEELRCFNGTDMDKLLPLMNRSIETMMIESAGLNPPGFSPAYLQNLEKHSPLRFEFIRKKKSQSKSQRFNLFRKYFEQAPGNFIPPKNNTTN
jgi:hypothetical protein